jgi:pyruvate/2-oxoglutarate dehydrogenase complex dihydrolipoamide acyltransferase (E2) component
MAIVEVKVPQLSESIAEATMMTWKKKAGEAVAVDEILIEIETDKVVLEVPAPASGVLAEIVQGDGATVTTEQLIAKIDTDAVAGAAELLLPSLHQLPLLRLQPPPLPPTRAMWPCPPPPSCWLKTTCPRPMWQAQARMAA